MKGSWAGAMGQSQFMPSSFLSYAYDYNGDGGTIFGPPVTMYLPQLRIIYHLLVGVMILLGAEKSLFRAPQCKKPLRKKDSKTGLNGRHLE